LAFRQKIEEHLCALCAGTGIDLSSAPRGQPTASDGRIRLHPIAGPTGLRVIPSQIEALFASGDARLLWISTIAEGSGFLVSRDGYYVKLSLVVPNGRTELEANVRAFFKRHEIPEIAESANAFQLPDRCASVEVLVMDLLERCFGVGEDDSLRIGCSWTNPA
jgi:hypothetical protein